MQLQEERKLQIQNTLDNSIQLIDAGAIKEGVESLVFNLKKVTEDLSQEVVSSQVRQECLQHPISKLLLEEPMTKWAFQKPRGYAGDAVLIDYMYRLKSCSPTDSYLSRELHGALTLAGSISAVRWRANHIAEQIEKHQKKVGKKIDIISVASGHLRELAYIKNASEKINRFVCLDQDDESNQVVRNTYEDYPFLEIIDDSIGHIYKRKLEGQKFDFIYSTGLFDYLNDKLASRMIEILYSNLKEGGQMIIPNFLKGITESAYMETFMEWNLIYRNEEDMRILCSSLEIPNSKKEIYYDDMKKVVYLKITK